MKRILQKFRHYQSTVGLRGAFLFCISKLMRKKPLFAAKLADLRFPVYIRLGTTDASVLKQVLVEKHYAFRLQFSPKTIIDAGANIGLSAVFFANRFPDATILAVEPEESNFQLLLRNIAAYPNIVPVQAALWNTEGTISLSDPGTGNHGFQTKVSQEDRSSPDQLVRATTIEALMRDAGWTNLDLLKLDIEGSEKTVLDAGSVWIGRVNAIMAELHDNLVAGCSASFAIATADFADGGKCGESIMVLRRSLPN